MGGWTPLLMPTGGEIGLTEGLTRPLRERILYAWDKMSM